MPPSGFLVAICRNFARITKVFYGNGFGQQWLTFSNCLNGYGYLCFNHIKIIAGSKYEHCKYGRYHIDISKLLQIERGLVSSPRSGKLVSSLEQIDEMIPALTYQLWSKFRRKDYQLM